MAKIFLIIVVILGVVYFVVNREPAQEEMVNNDTSNVMEDESMEKDDAMMEGDSMDGEHMMDATGITYVDYENRARNYSIQRPDKWYWQHYIATQISDPDIVDYFITDPQSAPRLNSEYLGLIVIEVSKRDITDFSDSVSSLDSQQVNIAGQDATRYSGQVDDQTRIEYHFVRDDLTYRLMYHNNSESTEELEAAFETLISSFNFN